MLNFSLVSFSIGFLASTKSTRWCVVGGLGMKSTNIENCCAACHKGRLEYLNSMGYVHIREFIWSYYIHSCSFVSFVVGMVVFIVVAIIVFSLLSVELMYYMRFYVFLL
ncbi:hypothetical protein BDR03DRAFT_970305 [Suillus americanus]|nr:hypothetical protein BDR03DRAFT_970305 [Suillus americanus]